MQDVPLPDCDLGGLRLEPLPLPGNTAKFDLTLMLPAGSAWLPQTLSLAPLAPDGAGLAGALEYACDLFDHTAAARLAASFVTLLTALAGGAVAQAQQPPIAELPLLCGGRAAAAAGVAAGEAVLPAAPEAERETIASLFAAQAARTPDAVAVTAAGGGDYRVGGCGGGEVSAARRC